MVADDAVVNGWIKNLDLFEKQGRELVVTNYNFKTVGRKRVALIIPKEEIISHSILPGDGLVELHTPSGIVPVNPILITFEQSVKLTKDTRVREIWSLGRRLDDEETKHLLKTVKAND